MNVSDASALLAELQGRDYAYCRPVMELAPWGDQGLLNGFQPTTDAAYDVVRDTATVLDLDLGKMK